MPVKPIVVAAMLGLLWWAVGRQERTSSVSSHYPTAAPAKQASDHQRNKVDTPANVAVAPSSGALAVVPLPQVSQNSQPVSSPVVLTPRPLPIDGVTTHIIDSLMTAIVSQESSGNINLEHPTSKAIGLGQVLPSNIPTWTRETFGQELTVDQFRGNQDVQIYTIRYKLYEYYRRAIATSGGDLHLAVRRVAAQWYSGQSDLYESTKPVATGPSIRDYSLQVLGRFQNFYPQNYIVSYR
jgi:hypothetical protein